MAIGCRWLLLMSLTVGCCWLQSVTIVCCWLLVVAVGCCGCRWLPLLCLLRLAAVVCSWSELVACACHSLLSLTLLAVGQCWIFVAVDWLCLCWLMLLAVSRLLLLVAAALFAVACGWSLSTNGCFNRWLLAVGIFVAVGCCCSLLLAIDWSWFVASLSTLLAAPC